MERYRHIFGPVLSRRLGLSLGVDLVDHKICSLNCIYCECGRTTDLTLNRREYVSVSEIISELSEFLRDLPQLDYITYSGSGEPLLNVGMKEITRFLKKYYPQYRVALLTNGTLFSDDSIIDELDGIDLVIPSLDAVSRDLFEKINRPHKGLDIDKIIKGLINLRKNYTGLIYLEIFIVPGINDSEDEILKLSEVVKQIMPDKVQLNSLDRPPAEDSVRKADYEALMRIAAHFEPVAEVIGDYCVDKIDIRDDKVKGIILETIRRRPVTKDELKQLFGPKIKDLDEIIESLIKGGEIKIINGPRGGYFTKI